MFSPGIINSLFFHLKVILVNCFRRLATAALAAKNSCCPTIQQRIFGKGKWGLRMQSSTLILGVACLLAFATATTAQAGLIFNFDFDNSPDGLITPPLVGTGTFSFDTDPGDGSHALTSLGPYNFSFTFGLSTFTESNLMTPVGEVLVVLSTAGPVRRVQFSNSNPGGPSGPSGGSIDFFDGSKYLSFEPPGIGNLDLYLMDGYFGNYVGTSVPEPSTYAITLAGLAWGGFSKWRRRNRA